jgi:hypothetical protein
MLMFDPQVAALFPLPLATFEKYMLLDDRQDYPMAFAFQLKLSGDIDPAAFQSAFDDSLAHHPLLCALVERAGRSGLVWKLAEQLRPTIDWDAPDVDISSSCGKTIDLSSEVGLRVWVRRGYGAADVTLQFHHACCDAIGAIGFIGDLLAAYGARTSPAGRRPTLRPCDPMALAKRGQYAAENRTPGSQTNTLWTSIRDAVRWLGRRPVILPPSAATSQRTIATIPLLGMHRYVFDRSETAQIREIATRQGVTVNDLLLRDLFLTLRQWIGGKDSRYAGRWLRIAIPVNLRAAGDNCMSAANEVSYTFLARHPRQCTDPNELLKGIPCETDAITRRRRSLLFVRGFRFMERIPGAIPIYMRMNRCYATAVLSNISDVTRHMGEQFPRESDKIVAGNLILEDIFSAPPVRPNTRAAFLIGRYAGRLWVGLRCDPNVLTDADAGQLLSLYIEHTKSTISR